jgi:hypothetical protein
LLLGPVGVELPSDDELPPQAAVRRAVAAVAYKKKR